MYILYTALKLKQKGETILYLAVYLPMSDRPESLQEFEKLLKLTQKLVKKKKYKAPMVISGDFNARGICWKEDPHLMDGTMNAYCVRTCQSKDQKQRLLIPG